MLANLLINHQRETVFAAAGLFIAIYASLFVFSVVTAENLTTVHGTFVGGDFMIFWTVAQNMFAEGAAALYDAENLERLMLALFPEREKILMSWQYPPTMMVMIAPAAALPYLPAYFGWLGINTALLGTLLARMWRNKAALILALTSLAAFQGWITGQTGLLTAALIACAAAFADRRPVLAGIAAGLLTIKPQFGLLIPIAFAAAGCWRAFAVAALTGAALGALSVAAFGADAWLAFIEAVKTHGERMQSVVFPYNKVISPFGAVKMLGAPNALALGVHGLSALALAGFVFTVWRRSKEWDIRAIALCAAAPLATPYAFYYELPIFIAPLFLVARRASMTGWLPGEKLSVMALWVAPLFLPGASAVPGVPLAFLVAAGAFTVSARRVFAEMGNGITSPLRGGR